MWQFFKKSENGSEAVCDICRKKYTTGGRTTALKNHLIRIHKSMIASDSSTTKITEFFQKQKPVEQYPQNYEKKKHIDRAIGLMVAIDFQPFQIVENTGFQTLIEELDPHYKIICRQKLTKFIIPEIYYLCKLATEGILNDVPFLSLTADGWTSVANEAYIGVTCHFINADWEFQRMLLDVLEVTSFTEDDDEIARIIEKSYRKHNGVEKVLSVTTDEVAVMISTVILPFLCYETAQKPDDLTSTSSTADPSEM